MIASYRRPYLLHDIRERTRKHDVSLVRATDFTLGPGQELLDLGRRDGLLPYCFDAAADRVLYTDVPDMERALAAPFLYQGQYAGARHVIRAVSRWAESRSVLPARP